MRATLAATVVLMWSAGAWGFGISEYNGYTIKWDSASPPYELDHDGTSDIPDGSDLVAVRQSITDWNSVGCSTLNMIETGTTTSTNTLLTEENTDGHNRLVWVEDSRWSFGQYVLGVTAPVFDYYGVIGEADIAFNGYSASWSTDDGGSATDVKSVAIHELGHFFGLQHVLNGEYSDDPPTMAPVVDPYLRTRSLHADDMSGVCFLYPSGTYACDEDCDCPALVETNNYGQEYNAGRFMCSSGSCGAFNENAGGTSGSTAETCLADVATNGGTCACDEGPGCTSGCGCDAGCTTSNTCACDTTWECTPDCPCDPECSGVNNCVCDTTYDCDENCACDAECNCACDLTYNCDDDCDCDPECKGCAAVSPERGGPTWLAALVLLVVLGRRRR